MAPSKPPPAAGPWGMPPPGAHWPPPPGMLPGMMPPPPGYMPPPHMMPPGMQHPGMHGYPMGSQLKGKKEKKEGKEKEKEKRTKGVSAKQKKAKKAASDSGGSEGSHQETDVSSNNSDADSKKEKRKKKQRLKDKKPKKRRKVQHSSDDDDDDADTAARKAAAKAAVAGYPPHPPHHMPPMMPPHWLPGMPPPGMPPTHPMMHPSMHLGRRPERSKSRDPSKAPERGEYDPLKLPSLDGAESAERSQTGRNDGSEKIDIMQVPSAMMSRVIGKAGATIKEIRDQTGARVEARDQTEDPVEVVISGSAEAVENAKAMLLNVVEGAEVQGSISFGGSAASAASGSASEMLARPTRFSSPGASAAAAAAAAIAAAVSAAKGTSGADKAEEFGSAAVAAMIEEHVDLPKHATGKIIGTKGQQIADIRQQSGAQVDIDKAAAGCRVRVVGTQDQVEKAKKLLQAIVEPSNVDGPCEFMEIPKTSVGRVIGAGGSRIAEMQEKSGAKIDIDRSTDRVMVRFSGQQDTIDKAKNLLLEVLEGRSTSIGEASSMLEVPPSSTGRLIGPGGRQINEIQEKSGAKVDIDKTRDPCIVRFTGTKEAVEQAEAMVKDVVAMALARTPNGSTRRRSGVDEETITFEVPQEIVSRMVGDGAWIRSTMQKTGARIVVKYLEGKTLLELNGHAEQVVEAEAMAEDAARDFKELLSNFPSPLAPTLRKAPPMPPAFPKSDSLASGPMYAKSAQNLPNPPPRPPSAVVSDWQRKAQPAMPPPPQPLVKGSATGIADASSAAPATNIVSSSVPVQVAPQELGAAPSQPMQSAPPQAAVRATVVNGPVAGGPLPNVGASGMLPSGPPPTGPPPSGPPPSGPPPSGPPPSGPPPSGPPPSGPPPSGPPPSGPPPSGPPPSGPPPSGPPAQSPFISPVPLGPQGPPTCAAPAGTTLLQAVPMTQPQAQQGYFAPTLTLLPTPGGCILPPGMAFAPPIFGTMPGGLFPGILPMPGLG